MKSLHRVLCVAALASAATFAACANDTAGRDDYNRTSNDIGTSTPSGSLRGTNGTNADNGTNATDDGTMGHAAGGGGVAPGAGAGGR